MGLSEKTSPEAVPRDEHADNKEATEHVDFEKPALGAEDVPMTSAYAGWSRNATIRKFWRLYLLGMSCSVGALYIGYANSVVGSIIANKGFIDHFATVTDPETGEPALDTMHISLWSAVWYVTQVFVQIASPVTADRWGRKFNMWLLTFFLLLSIVLAIVSHNYIVLTFSRISAGVASGLISTSIMVYMSEVSMPQFRGTLLSSFSFFFALGQAFLAIGLKILNDSNPMAFRNMFYSEFVFAGIWMVPMIMLPESPAWYASKGRHEDAKKSLRRLVGNVEGYDVEREYRVMREEIEQSIATQKENSDNNWKAMLAPTNIRRTIIAALPFTYQNFVGVPLIFGYTTYFFQLAKMKDPFLGNMIIQIILLVGILCAFYWVDKAGRRILCIGGGVIMGGITFLIGGLAWLPDTPASGAALVSLCSIWAFVYANSLAPIGWVSLVEISTPHLRAKSAAIASVIQSLSGILFSYTVPLMLSNQGVNWGQKIGLFFGGLAWAYLLLIIFLYPETKGRTYQELDELFERKIAAWNFHKTKTAYETGMELRREGELAQGEK